MCVCVSFVIGECFVNMYTGKYLLCFGNMYTGKYLLFFFVLFRLCIFIVICFVSTGVRTTATEWQLNCSQ